MIGDAKMKEKKSVPPCTFEHFTSISSFSNVIPRLSKTWAFYIGILDQSKSTKMIALDYLAKLLPMNHAKTLL